MHSIQIDEVSVEEGSTEKKNERRELRIMLVPSLYSSVSYLGLLENLNNSKYKIAAIYTSGFTTVVAALFSKYKVTSVIEWKIFKLIQELEGKAPYGERWTSITRDFIHKEFKDVKVADLDVKIIGSTYRGESLEKLLNVELSLKSVTRLSRSFENVIISSGGAVREELLSISSLPSKLDLIYQNDYLFGVYGGAYRLHQEETIIKIEVKSNIDDVKMVIENMNKSKSMTDELLKGTVFEITN